MKTATRITTVILAALALAAILAPHAHAADEPLWFMPLGRAQTNSSYPLVKAKPWSFAQDLDYSSTAFRGKLRIGYLNEGHMADPRRGTWKRDGVYANWIGTHWLSPHFAVEASFGPYVTATTVPQTGNIDYRDEYRLAGIAGVGLRAQFNRANVMLGWQRPMFTKVAGGYADCDVYGIWFGYRP